MEKTLQYTLLAASGLLAASSFDVRGMNLMVLFLLYETCVGMYFPAMGMMRAAFIPEHMRATVMNIQRYETLCMLYIYIYIYYF